MKKLSRVLAVVLAAALLLSCSSALAADFTAPGKVKDIADVPEMPSVPTMKTKNNGVTETISLSDELEWLSAVWNWNWVSIELDGTTATYDIAANNKKYKCQQGMGTWESTWDAPWLYVEDEPIMYDVFNEYKDSDPDAWDNWYADAMAYLKANNTITYEVVKYPHGVDRHSAGYIVVEFDPAEDGDEEYFGEGYLGTWFAYVTCDKWSEGFGTYEMKAYQGYGNGDIGVEFAFDGATKDGVSVKYDRAGRNTACSVKSDDVNVFGTEIAPTSTEFVWVRFKNMYGATTYYLHTIIASYDEGDYSSIQAWYSSNGNLIQAHATKAE